jgi:hypothetical protein
VRSAGPNPAPDPRAMAEFLWRDDALALLEARGAARGMRGKPRRVYGTACAKCSASRRSLQPCETTCVLG